MKKKIIKTISLISGLCMAVMSVFAQTVPVYGFVFSKDQAYNTGTLTITADINESKNGYGRANGYTVTYSISDPDMVAFDQLNGCGFLVGNDFSATGGCSFCRLVNGDLWEHGAVQLGAIHDGVLVSSNPADINGYVSCSFHVNDLSELPAYIGYFYQPNGVFLHINEHPNNNCHIWYYHALGNSPVSNQSAIDMSAPEISVNVTPGGTTAHVNGKTWGTEAVINAIAKDNQSRPQRVQFLQNGSVLKENTNEANVTEYSTSFVVRQNGTYQAIAYDQLGNGTSPSSANVDCIDVTAPEIQSFGLQNGGYAKTQTLVVSALDRGCGLDSNAYSLNGGSWTSQNSFVISENGNYEIRVRDALGNVSSKQYQVSTIDKNPPTVSEIKRNHNQGFCKSDILTITASDGESGLPQNAYSWNHNGFGPNNSLTIENNGIYSVVVKDQAGNEATKSITILNIDRCLPSLETEILSSGTVAIVDGEAFSENKSLQISASDDGSGIKEILVLDGEDQEYFSFKTESPIKEHELQVEDMPAGNYKVVVKDACLNEKVDTVLIENVDNSPPSIHSISINSIDDEKVKITVNATDDGCGLPENAYSFDGGNTWQTEPFLIVDKNAEYEIVVRDYMEHSVSDVANVTTIKKKEEPKKDNNRDNTATDTPPIQEPSNDDKTSTDTPNTKSDNTSNNASNNASDNTSNNTSDNTSTNDNPAQNDTTQNIPIQITSAQNTTNSNNKNDDSQKKKTQNTKKNNDDTNDDELLEDIMIPIVDNQELDQPDEKKQNITKETVQVPPETYQSDNPVSPNKITKTQSELQKEKAKKIAVISVCVLAIGGLVGGFLFFYLTYLHYSCVLYGIDEKRRKIKIGRVSVRSVDDEWNVTVPDHKLGTHGTGNYMIEFSNTFAIEEKESYVVIQIEKNRIREKIKNQVYFHIS